MVGLNNLSTELLQKLNESTNILRFILKEDMTIVECSENFPTDKGTYKSLYDLVTYTHRERFKLNLNQCIEEKSIVSFSTNFCYNPTDVEDIPSSYNIAMQYIKKDNIIVVAEPIPILKHENAKAYFSMINDYSYQLRKNHKLNYRIQEKNQEIKKYLKELKINYDTVNKLTKNVPGVIYQYKLDSDGHSSFPFATKGITEIYEVEPKDVIEDAQPVFDNLHPDDYNMIRTSILESAQSMEDWKLQYRVDLPKKGVRWLEGIAKPEKLEDGSVLWHGYIHDITELKNKDKILISQSRLAAMGEMISMIAHQWRQPLSVISMGANNMLVDIALENFSIPETEKYAYNIIEQTQHLSQTIDDFRNFFKTDKKLVEINIEETIDKTLSIVQDSLKNNNIQLTTSFETDIKVKVYPRELMQVFVNIINNSKDALVSYKPDNALISIRVYEDGKYVNTEICDNGGGIKDDILPKVFDPYFSTKDEKNGTGLGLYMSKVIIENHLSGIIEANNQDKGACFTVGLLKEEKSNIYLPSCS